MKSRQEKSSRHTEGKESLEKLERVTEHEILDMLWVNMGNILK